MKAKMLSNEVLRERSVRGFLQASGIDASKININSIDGLFAFKTDDASIPTKLQSLFNKQMTTLNLSGILKEEVNGARSKDKSDPSFHKLACLAILDLIGSNVNQCTFSSETGMMEIPLPSPAYAPLFNLLNYEHISVTQDGRLFFNIQSYLKKQPQTLTQLGNIVFLNTQSLSSSDVFYVTKDKESGKKEVTPYFFVPVSTTPPKYLFLLDVSTSMDGERIAKLKASVSALAEQLFAYQPQANVEIIKFATKAESLGVFKDFSSLQAKVQKLTADGSTRLYGTSLDTLNTLALSAKPNNVLLFTDGEDSTRDLKEMGQLTDLINGLSLEAKARNKFFVIFCGTDGDALSKDIAKTFDSPVIHTQSADFMNAIQDPEKLKSYAAERGLFTVKYSVHLETGPKSESNTHLIADLSGQIVALEPLEINPNSTLSITIAQGDQTLVDSKKSFTPPVVQQGTNPNGFLNRSPALSSAYQDPLNPSQFTIA